MGLLYKNEHLTCIHYKRENPPIRIYKISKGGIFENERQTDSLLLFLKKGELSISYNGFIDESLKEGEIILLPTNCALKANVLEDAHFLTFSFNTQVQLCANFSMTQLYPYCKDEYQSKFSVLKFNEHIKFYVELLEFFIKDGVNCVHLYELKKQELFYIFRAYYTKESLAAFFYPVLDKEDIHFKKFILENCLSAKNVSELARMANYSTSGFIKKFTRSFDASPYRWVSQYKAECILQDIYSEEKTFKEISDHYGFSSIPHFIEFCKKQYGTTPGKIRKKKQSLETLKNNKGKNM